MTSARFRILVLGTSLLVVGASGCNGGGGGGNTGGGDSASFSAVKQAAARYSACTGQSLGGGDELSWEVPASLVACVRAAADCSGVLACEDVDTSATCDVAAFDSSCTGGKILTTCASYPNELAFKRRRNCDKQGLNNLCLADRNNRPTCAAALCSETEEADGDACTGTVLSGCAGGLRYKYDCFASGMGCGMEERGVAYCRAPAETCARSHCEGHTLVACGDDGQSVEGRVDCPRFGRGFTCVEDRDGPRCDIPDAAEACVQGDTACVGAAARVCLRGNWIEFDCAAFRGGVCLRREGRSIRCKLPDWQ